MQNKYKTKYVTIKGKLVILMGRQRCKGLAGNKYLLNYKGDRERLPRLLDIMRTKIEKDGIILGV